MTGHIDDLSYCPRCASAGWIPTAMYIDLDGVPTGYTFPVTCAECGYNRPHGPVIGQVHAS